MVMNCADGLSWQGTKFKSSGVFARRSGLFICLPACYRIVLQSINKCACPGTASLRHKRSALTQSLLWNWAANEEKVVWKCRVDKQYLFRELKNQKHPGKVFVYRSGIKTLQWMPENWKVPQTVAWEQGEQIMLLQRCMASSRDCKHASVLFAFAFCWSSDSSLLHKPLTPKLEQMQLGKMQHLPLPRAALPQCWKFQPRSQGCPEDISAPQLLRFTALCGNVNSHLLCFVLLWHLIVSACQPRFILN